MLHTQRKYTHENENTIQRTYHVRSKNISNATKNNTYK